MKKYFFSSCIFLSFGFFVSAQTNQFRVNNTGSNAGIVLGADIQNQIGVARMRMNNSGTSFTRTVSVENVNLGAGTAVATLFQSKGTNTSAYRIGFQFASLSGGAWDFGVYTASINSISNSSGRAYGVYGLAGNATSGYNYGIFGELYGTQFGSAVVGKISSASMSSIPSQFAGWFLGRTYMSERLGIGITAPTEALDVVGSIRYSGNCYKASDSRFKTNVTVLGSSLEQIGKLRPVKYNLKPKDYTDYYEIHKASVVDTGKVVINGDDDLRNVFALDNDHDVNKNHFGFIAQEFKEIFPDLVNEDEKGMLSIDYVSLIPVLVETIQELSETIQSLNQRLQAVENTNSNHSAVLGLQDNNVSFSLFPNPTSGFVTVNYSLNVDAPVLIELFNSFGQRVKFILPQKNQKAGQYSVQTSVADLNTGAYIVKVTSNYQSESKQLIVNN